MSGLFLSWGMEGREKGLTQPSSVSLILSYESAVINTTAKAASLPIAAGGKIVDNNLVSGDSSDHGYQPDFWQQHGSRTLA